MSREAWRTYAAAALSAIKPTITFNVGGWSQNETEGVAKYAALIADAMLAEEQKRFPDGDKHCQVFVAGVPRDIDPLAGTANDYKDAP